MASSSNAVEYERVDGDIEKQDHGANDEDVPQQWNLCFKPGAGQFEFQGFEFWTGDEQEMYRRGDLRAKWGIGQVSIRVPVSNFCTFVSLVYGFLPFIIPLWWLIWMIETWIRNGKPQFFPTYGLVIATGFALVNEAIVKPICKCLMPTTVTDRPPEAVCNHPGMPSGHVMNAYTLMTWCFLEACFESHVHIEWLLIIIVVVGPTPWARVYNKDHTGCQVAVSAAVATVMGMIAFAIRYYGFPHHSAPWDYVNAGPGVSWSVGGAPP